MIVININDSHDVLHHHLYITIMIEPKGEERAVSLNLPMIVLIINLMRGES
jgi:hypothetical protein